MKNVWITLIAVALGCSAAAQDNAAAVTIEKRASIATEKIAEKLGLNQSQKEKLRAIHLQEMEAKEALREEIRKEMEAQREEMKAQREALKNDEAAQQAHRKELAEKRAALNARKNDIEAQYRSQVKAVLSEAQYEEYLLMKGRMQGSAKARGVRKAPMARPMAQPTPQK